MAPTRELCQQIYDEATKFVKNTGLKCCVLYGGTEMRQSLDSIRGGCDICVATPGRLDDLVSRKQISLKNIAVLVLDEADRMLDIGFEPQIRNIVQKQVGSFRICWVAYQEHRAKAGRICYACTNINQTQNPQIRNIVQKQVFYILHNNTHQ